MGFFSKWKKHRELSKQAEHYKNKAEELENRIAILLRNSRDGNQSKSLLEDFERLQKDFLELNREYEKLKEWSQRILEISKEESSELASLKYRFFKLTKEHEQFKRAYTGASKELDFAFAQFDRLRDENEILKAKLRKYEGKN
jgi:chromosome segregation ATPase